jgi:hypothetical protein
MNRTSFSLAITGLVASLLTVAGCGGNDGSGDEQNSTGILSIGITDAPVDEAAAVVIAMTEFVQARR